MARAASGEISRQSNGRLQVLFFNASGSELKSKWQGLFCFVVSSLTKKGGTEKQIELFFRCAEEGAKLVEKGVSVDQLSKGIWKPEKVTPVVTTTTSQSLSILFMDEIDAIAGKRDGGDKTMVTLIFHLSSHLKLGPINKCFNFKNGRYC